MNDPLLTIFTAWFALGTAALSPGPNMVAVASRGLGSGRGPALFVALGIALGGFCWATVTSLGIGALLASFPILLNAIGILGGLYLGWLGFKGWRAALTAKKGDISPKASKGIWLDMRHGFLVTASNPKAALLWLSLSTFVCDQDTSGSLLLFAAGSAFVLFAVYGTYGLLFSLGGIRHLYAKFSRLSEASFGTIFGAIGIGMIMRSI